MRQHFPFTAAAPGADSDTYALFSSRDDAVRSGQLTRDVWRAIAITIANSQAGTLKAYESNDDATTWTQFASVALSASEAGETNNVVLGIDQARDCKVEWVNGGSAQATWYANVVLTDEPSSSIDAVRHRTAASSSEGDQLIDGDLEVSGTLATGDDLDVTGDIAVSGTVDGRDVAADGATFTAASRGYRGSRAITLTTDTAVLDDAGKLNTCAHASGTAATVPPNSGVAFGLWEVLAWTQIAGAGAITVTAGIGVTLTVEPGKTLVSSGVGAIVKATKVATNIWHVSGALVAA